MVDTQDSDSEISSYETESEPNNQSSFISENTSEKAKNENSYLGYEGIYSILINRYNQEVSQKSTVRNQSVFILTAMGFLITSSFGIISADWFDLASLSIINNILYVILATIVALCFLIAILCLIGVGIISNKFYWKYPNNAFLTDCSDGKIMRYAFDRTYPSTNITALSEIIQRNQQVNHIFRYFIIVSGILLITSFVIIVIILGILLIENYNNALLNAPLANSLMLVFCT